MNSNKPKTLITLIFSYLLLSNSIIAQSWLPPGGNNQYSSVTQKIGLVEVNITYNAPNVTSPQGIDRTGKIWGELVPYGFADMNGTPIPWRVGANENTTFSVSHGVQIEGQELPAGKYGLFMVPGEEEWIVIFSKVNNKWGAFSYDEKEDALRVNVKPESNQFTRWLTFDFVSKESDAATVAMKWENLMVPFKITVPKIHQYYVNNIREKFGLGAVGFTPDNLIQAASYCLSNNTELEQALQWANAAARPPFPGRYSFRTFAVQSIVLSKLERDKEAQEAWNRAIGYMPDDPKAILFEGWYLINIDAQSALDVFKLNEKKFPEDVFTVNEGLARGYTAVGETKKAIKHWEIAIKNVPEADKQWLPFYEQALAQLKAN